MVKSSSSWNMHLISKWILLKVQDRLWMLCSTLLWSMATEASGEVAKKEILYQLCFSLPSSPNILCVVDGNWEGEEESQGTVRECDCVQMQRSMEKKKLLSLNSFEMEFWSSWDYSCRASLLKPSCVWQDALFSKHIFVSYPSILFLYY